MRQQTNARTITVKKSELIEQIQKNKEAHIKEYAEAIDAYRNEARKQLTSLSEGLTNGKLDLKLSLISPKNEEAEYDKLLLMFRWELNDTVELSQGEFNEYVLDETPFAIQAKYLNSSYKF